MCNCYHAIGTAIVINNPNPNPECVLNAKLNNKPELLRSEKGSRVAPVEGSETCALKPQTERPCLMIIALSLLKTVVQLTGAKDVGRVHAWAVFWLVPTVQETRNEHHR